MSRFLILLNAIVLISAHSFSLECGGGYPSGALCSAGNGMYWFKYSTSVTPRFYVGFREGDVRGSYSYEEYIANASSMIAKNGIDYCAPMFGMDSDGDGVGDGAELIAGTNPYDPNDEPATEFLEKADDPAHNDWLVNHPLWKVDSDGDGHPDVEEWLFGTDAGDPYDFPRGSPHGPGTLLPPWYPYPEEEGGGDPGGGDSGGGDSGGGDSGGGDSGGGDSGGGDSGGGDSGGGDSGGGDSGGGDSGGGDSDGGGLGGIEKRLDTIIGKMGKSEIKIDVDNGRVEGLLSGISDKLDKLLEPGEGEGSGLGEFEEWVSPEKTEEMEFKYDIEDAKKRLDDSFEGLGLSPTGLGGYSPRDFNKRFTLPIGGSLSSVRMTSFDFSLTKFPSEVNGAMSEIRRFINILFKSVMTVMFVLGLYRLLWR